MANIPTEIQNQGNWEQLLRGNYRKGERMLRSIMSQPTLAQQLISNTSALYTIYNNIRYSDASCLLAKVMDAAGEPYGTKAFNNFCGCCGVSIGSTWAATCANATAKAQIVNNLILLNVVSNSPSLLVAFGAVPAVSLAVLKNAIAQGLQSACLGLITNIAVGAFSFGGTSFAAATSTFEVVGADIDKDVNGATLPLTLFCKDLHTASTFVQNSNNSNTFNSLAISNTASIYNALPTDWRNSIAVSHRQYALGGNGSTLTTCDARVIFYREGDIFQQRTYSRAEEFAICKQYPTFKDGRSKTLKKYANGTGGAATWWEASPYSGDTNGVCNVNSDGSPSCNNANNSYGLCFGFCLAR